MLGICPNGNPVVSAETNPVATANTTTYLMRGNNTIHRNNIAKDISGFNPTRNRRTTSCNAAPIPTNNDKITNTLVFICKLSSTILYSFSQTYTICRLRKRVFIIANFHVNKKVYFSMCSLMEVAMAASSSEVYASSFVFQMASKPSPSSYFGNKCKCIWKTD